MNMKKINLHSYPNGDQLHMRVYEFDSNKPGPHIYVQANVHGSELQGNALIYHLIKHLENNEFSGKWTIVPQANPVGINSKSIHFTNGRISQISGENFNRTYTDLSNEIPIDEYQDLSNEEIRIKFKKYLKEKLDEKFNKKAHYGLSYTERLSYELQSLSTQADIVLDFHNDTISPDYIYAPKYLSQRVKYLDFEMAIIIPHEFAGAMDEASFMPWIKLYEGLGRECPFIGLTLELGDEEAFCSNRGKLQLEKVLSFIGTKSETNIELYDLGGFKTYRASIGALVHYHAKSGDYIKEGDLLCELYIEEKTVKKVYALKDGRILNRCPSSNIQQGMRLFQILESN